MTHEPRRGSLGGPPISPTLVGQDLVLLEEEDEEKKSRVATLYNHLNNLCTTMASPPHSPPTTSSPQPAPASSQDVVDDYSLFLNENAHLSFENPNFSLDAMAALDPARLDDHLNSNVLPVSVFEELRQSAAAAAAAKAAAAKSKSSENSSSSSDESNKPNRKAYAAIDISAMGVDVALGPTTELDNKLVEEKLEKKSERKKLEEGEIESDKLVESDREKGDKSDGEQDTKEGVDDNEENSKLSSQVVVRRSKKKKDGTEALPPGWERHEDNEGPYYWQVKTGNIQRQRPEPESRGESAAAAVVRDVRSSKIFDDDFDPLAMAAAAAAAVAPRRNVMSKSCTSGSIAEMAAAAAANHTVPVMGGHSDAVLTPPTTLSSRGGQEWKRRSMPPAKNEATEDQNKPIQVRVRSLGCIELREDELTPENSSKAVNRCIVQLANEVDAAPEGKAASSTSSVDKWGEGGDLVMELHEGTLKLVHPDSGVLVHAQPIHSIRVWGVGRDNGQDFAYVARDRRSRRHLCHVYRCDAPARTIANALRDICKKILIERSLAQSSSKLLKHHQHLPSQQQQQPKKMTRPTSLGAKLQTKALAPTSAPLAPACLIAPPDSFPTPMEEPRKVLRALYVGSIQVDKPCGIDVVRAAIDKLMEELPRAQWRAASVAVAPSTVTVAFSDGSEALDCRVRFLSFLGMGSGVQQAAFIMHTAQDTFVAHVFHCEPTAGPLCKTIEAACKLRYQKCLDARPQQRPPPGANADSNTNSSRFSALKTMLARPWAAAARIKSPPTMTSS